MRSRNQKERRRRIIRLMLVVVVIFALLLIAFWFWVTQPLLSSATANAERTVDTSRLEAHVRKLSIELAPRDESHVENLDRVADYIKSEFTEIGASVSEQSYVVQGKSYRNVIAQFGPETEERIIVGAHYDAAGRLPGADDNASGVAGLIELARLFGPAYADAASGTGCVHSGRAAIFSDHPDGQCDPCRVAA